MIDSVLAYQPIEVLDFLSVSALIRFYQVYLCISVRSFHCIKFVVTLTYLWWVGSIEKILPYASCPTLIQHILLYLLHQMVKSRINSHCMNMWSSWIVSFI